MGCVAEDALGKQGRAIFLAAPGGSVFNQHQVGAWVKPTQNGDVALLVVNHGKAATSVVITRAQLGMGESSYLVATDLWSNATTKIQPEEAYSTTLKAPDGFVMVRIAEKAPVTAEQVLATPPPPPLKHTSAASSVLKVDDDAAVLVSRTTTLSNTELPRDQFGNPLVTGEADILVHPTDGHYYFFFNNWGNCSGVNCCSDETVGCRSCCFRVKTITCVEMSNHSVVVYRTQDLARWEYLGEALSAAARPDRAIEYRPHVVWNNQTQLFVMWYNIYAPNERTRFRYAVAVSKTAQGPFGVTSTNVTMHAQGVKVGDLDIFVDSDGAAFLVHGDTHMAVEKLDPTFTKSSGEVTYFTTPIDKYNRGSEGPVFFKRGHIYYILPGTGCCGCIGGSNMYVFTSLSPMGPYIYRGDVGSNTTAPFDMHSPWNYPTRAQASAVVQLHGKGGDSREGQVLWMGNQWVTSREPGRPRNHDLLYFWPLEFEPDGNLTQVRYEPNVQVQVYPPPQQQWIDLAAEHDVSRAQNSGSALKATTAATVKVDWSTEKVTTRTAATIEVDVMPFLGRADWGGPFNAYYEALANLGAEYVRFAPWFANPRVVVTELSPSDCTATKPASNWNSTFFDGIVRDFMAAVCGPNADTGSCKLSVVQQLSTMPSYMYKGGYCPDATGCLPDYPWNTTDPFNAYNAGSVLVDPTCGEMARYVARLVAHYTTGGHHDECGHWHASGFNYSWYGLSILNEDDHGESPDDGTAYTTCYDAIAAEVHKVNPAIVPVGPEIFGASGHATEYLMHFLNASNHYGYQGFGKGAVPSVVSYHWGSNAAAPAEAPQGGEKFLTDWETTLNDPNATVQKARTYIQQTGQASSMVLNEFIPMVADWCDVSDQRSYGNHSFVPDGHCLGGTLKSPAQGMPIYSAGGNPDLRSKQGLGINRKTWSWNAAAACFAYGYGTLAELQYKYVGHDQLIGGVSH